MPFSSYPSLSQRDRRGGNLAVTLGLAAGIVFFLVSGIVAFRNTSSLLDDSRQVMRTHEVMSSLDDFLSLMKDAETGQRGFLITGNERYLDPFIEAKRNVQEQISRTESLLGNDSVLKDLLSQIKTHASVKFAELDQTIELRRTKGFEAAQAIVLNDSGKREMDAIRDLISQMEQREDTVRSERISDMDNGYRVAVISGILTALSGFVLSCLVAYLIHRANKARRQQAWLQSGKLGLDTAISGEQSLPQLGQSILGFLSRYVDAHASAMFARRDGDFQRIATYGVPAESAIPDRFGAGDGLLGRAVLDGTVIRIDDVPEGYLTVGSALGQGRPRQLLISPASSDQVVNAVIEIGFIHPLNALTQGFLSQASEMISIAVKSALYRESLQELLEETQRQSEELQTQSEELRVSNEELEEQSRALRESQSRLEQQQAELEQTNSQLEEQAQILETQRNDLVHAQAEVQAKASDLERASQYKSDFLANMSHELRTPLNSSLILSKLLADNPTGNLTDEQVKHASTIHSAGNDLLTLINDILDLSKIEAGHMEVHPEAVSVDRLLNDVRNIFEPIARQKGLGFTADLAENAPKMIQTDRQRLEQILRNLLSNAFKFTEHGDVKLTIGRSAVGAVTFAVSDTGIGISEEQQKTVFEAFRQADSTISRQFGGTGLGLSISRELARLLGGTISLHSVFGKGSTFTLLLPEAYQAGGMPIRAEAEVSLEAPPNCESKPPQTGLAHFLVDDREKLIGGRRIILVVEDDNSFARILYDLAHDNGFQCLLAANAEEALAAAKQFLPDAVLLDVGLPDNSGLSVLDRLKQNPYTRHIPVHVISAGDYAERAYSMGAIGYLLKPVRRDDVVAALGQLETRLGSSKTRRVLIVEDDAVQRGSMQKLLGAAGIETIPAATATECLEKLRVSTFDCMVLDLTLPDTSGYALLETLSKEDAYSFPPVIVYTGRDLSSDEEHRLRRYSKSIIIKGAKSPERLLDEVTLFLHQVVADLPPEQQKMLERAHLRDATIEGRRILVVEDDVRNVYALTNILEPRGTIVDIARNGLEALDRLEKGKTDPKAQIDLVLMDVMMPEMDGLTATREIRRHSEWKKLPIIMLTAKAMKDDQERCLDAGANDYMAKPLDVEKLLSLVRVWMPRR